MKLGRHLNPEVWVLGFRGLSLGFRAWGFKGLGLGV